MYGINNRKLPSLKIRMEEDSEYNIENYIVNYDYPNITRKLGCNNAINFERFRIKTFILCIIICITPLAIALILDLVNFGFSGTSLWQILTNISWLIWLIGIIATLFIPRLIISGWVNKKLLLYLNIFEELLKNNYINNNINSYPQTIQMATFYNRKIEWGYFQNYDSLFPRWSCWASTWGLYIFIDKLNNLQNQNYLIS